MEAQGYDLNNEPQFKDGLSLIEPIKKNNDHSDIEYILDIGCGTGNLTVLLSDLNENSLKRIYAIDVQDHMIQFAKENYSRNNIEFITQDISLPWNELRPELRELKGKVSVIYSNYCLHWIYTKRENVIENMYRLLSEKVNIYTNISVFQIPAEKVKSFLGAYILHIFNIFYSVPSTEQQENEWKESFKQNGFQILRSTLGENTSFIRTEIFEKSYIVKFI